MNAFKIRGFFFLILNTSVGSSNRKNNPVHPTKEKIPDFAHDQIHPLPQFSGLVQAGGREGRIHGQP